MRTIRHYVDLRAREQPDAPYLIAPETGRTLTYRQLKRDSEELGRHLGDLLAKAGIEAARAEGLTLVVHCPFVRAYLRRHPS